MILVSLHPNPGERNHGEANGVVVTRAMTLVRGVCDNMVILYVMLLNVSYTFCHQKLLRILRLLLSRSLNPHGLSLEHLLCTFINVR